MTNNVEAFIQQARRTPVPFDTPRRPPPKLPSEAHPPYVALRAATSGVVRALVDLHAPVDGYQVGDRIYGWVCRGCDSEGYETEPPDWPCRTTVTIADDAGVTVGGLQQARS
jgi:hypothetical protein